MKVIRFLQAGYLGWAVQKGDLCAPFCSKESCEDVLTLINEGVITFEQFALLPVEELSLWDKVRKQYYLLRERWAA